MKDKDMSSNTIIKEIEINRLINQETYEPYIKLVDLEDGKEFIYTFADAQEAKVGNKDTALKIFKGISELLFS